MMKRISRVAVVGSGVMGAGIAAHLANAGFSVLLLDIASPDSTSPQTEQSSIPEKKTDRNRLVRLNFEALLRQNPSPFYHPDNALRIAIGNLDDDLPELTSCHWIVEAVVESMEVKKKLIRKIMPFLATDTLITTNTSGLSVDALAENLPEIHRKNFLATHFFNPPRQMKLVEIVAGKKTDPENVKNLSELCRRRLGKGVVIAQDTPNFIANRIGVYALCKVIHLMLEFGLTVQDADAITGAALARPASATFKTLDLVGIDTFVHVAANAHKALESDDERDVFLLPAFIHLMIERKWLGNKTRQGFYATIKHHGVAEKRSFDYRQGEYGQIEQTSYESLAGLRGIVDPAERIKKIFAADDKAAEFAWRVLRDTLLYSFKHLPEIAEDTVSVDHALRWGFNWELGPFEIFDALGVQDFIRRAEADGVVIKAALREISSFYREGSSGQREQYFPGNKKYAAMPVFAENLSLSQLKKSGKTVLTGDECSLVDLGDGIFCFEFHSKMNAISRKMLDMLCEAIEATEENGTGLVLGNQGRHFSVGANLAYLNDMISAGKFAEIEKYVKLFQDVALRMKYAAIPVVAAPFNKSLGGGCELCLHADAVSAHAETCMGLVEVRVGLLPAGGGCKELLARADLLAKKYSLDIQQIILKYFWQIAKATVSKSAAELYALDYLDHGDRIVMDSDALISQAKKAAMHLAGSYLPRHPGRTFAAPGRSVAASVKSQLWNLKTGNYLSEYDYELGSLIADVLCGGDVLPGTEVSEKYLLNLERQAFLALCQRRQTQERIQHMLATGKPLRN